MIKKKIDISVSLIIVRYLELQSSGRKNEIRFSYTTVSADGISTLQTESFPYRLADDQWHSVSLSISGREIQLIIDCHPLYRRVTEHMPDRNFSASNMHLFIGQRNSKTHYAFKVIIFFKTYFCLFSSGHWETLQKRQKKKRPTSV